jgi:hypothetical protein
MTSTDRGELQGRVADNVDLIVIGAVWEDKEFVFQLFNEMSIARVVDAMLLVASHCRERTRHLICVRFETNDGVPLAEECLDYVQAISETLDPDNTWTLLRVHPSNHWQNVWTFELMPLKVPKE